MYRFALVLVLLVVAPAPPSTGPDQQPCLRLASPVPGPVIYAYEPKGQYAGHWGIDIAVPLGTTVRAADGGTVSFSGTVAENKTVSIDHGGGLKTSYSFLDSQSVGRGAWLATGWELGRSGEVHNPEAEIAALHFSVRINGGYVDPAKMLSCFSYDLSKALRLLPADQ